MTKQVDYESYISSFLKYDECTTCSSPAFLGFIKNGVAQGHEIRAVIDDTYKILHLIIYNHNGLWFKISDDFLGMHYPNMSEGQLREYKSRLKRSVAQTDSININKLDSNPYLLHCTDKTLNFETGQPEDHNKDNYLTKTTGLEFEIGSIKAEKWQEILDNFYQKNRHVLLESFMSQVIPNINRKGVRVLGISGPTNTCKTTISNILGMFVPVTTIGSKVIGRKSVETPYREADAMKRHLVCIDEKVGGFIDKETIKLWTGGSRTYQTRATGGGKVKNVSTMPHILTTSNDPFTDTRFDDGFYERLRYIESKVPKNYKHKENWIDDNILNNPKELAGILKRLLKRYPKRKFDDGFDKQTRFQKFLKEYQKTHPKSKVTP